MSSNPSKQERPTRRFYALSIFGAAFAGICILFFVAFIQFKPDQLSLSDRYFPSPTVTSTRTPTPTPTLNLTAIKATSTSQAVQTTIAYADSQWSILLTDGFISNNNQWDIGNDNDEYATIVRSIENGAYQWDATAKKGFIAWITADTKSVGDFLLEVEAQKTEGTRSSDYGLVFREDIGGNFYYFGIDHDSFFVSLNYNNKWIDLVDWTSSSAISPTSPNRLTVIATGSHFTFLINDQLVAYATDDRISRGTTGLAISIYQSDRQATFEFDNFELREP